VLIVHRNNRYFMPLFTFVKDYFVRRNKSYFVSPDPHSLRSATFLLFIASFHCCIAATGL
jgi:hypothetical protein